MQKNIRSMLLLLAAGLLWATHANSQSINQSRLGKGLQFEAADSSFSLRFTPLFQLQYAASKSENGDQSEDGFQLRRARLKFEGFAYSRRLTYKIQLGVGNRDIGGDLLKQQSFASNLVLDAFLSWQLTPGLALLAGQAKLPGNREAVISSQKLQFVDRSLLNARFNLDRDTGLQLHHEHSLGSVVLREIGAVSMGEGRNITAPNAGGYSYTGRLEILPFGVFESDYAGSDISREQTPKLALAASYDFNDDATRARGQLGSFLSAPRNLNTLFIDAMFKYCGFSAMAEYADRSAANGPVVLVTEDGSIKETFVTGQALNVQAGYLFKNNWEVSSRYTTYEPEVATGLSDEQQYTIGLSKYIVGHTLKVQSDLSLLQQESSNDTYQFRVQLQFAL